MRRAEQVRPWLVVRVRWSWTVHSRGLRMSSSQGTTVVLVRIPANPFQTTGGQWTSPDGSRLARTLRSTSWLQLNDNPGLGRHCSSSRYVDYHDRTCIGYNLARSCRKMRTKWPKRRTRSSEGLHAFFSSNWSDFDFTVAGTRLHRPCGSLRHTDISQPVVPGTECLSTGSQHDERRR